MIVINNVNENRFTLNGIQYLKNYISKVVGDRIEVFNCYESKDVLVALTHYSLFTVNGTIYTTINDLQENLLGILYNRQNLGEGVIPDSTTLTKGIVKLAGDLAGTADVPTVPKKLDIEAGTAIGSVISFTTDKVYGTPANPITGNITANITGGKLGVTNLLIHNSASIPSFGTEFRKYAGSLDYVPNVTNYIYMTYINTSQINYSIHQL